MKLKFKKPRLVEDWRDGWKWISSNSMLVATSIIGTWTMIPEDMRERFDENYIFILVIIILITGFIGRFIDQKKKKKTDVDNDSINS